MKSVGTISRYLHEQVTGDGSLAEFKLDLDLVSKQAVRIVDVRGVIAPVVGGSSSIYAAKASTDELTMSSLKYAAMTTVGTVSGDTRNISIISGGDSSFVSNRIGRDVYIGLVSYGTAADTTFSLEVVCELFDLTPDEFIATL